MLGGWRGDPSQSAPPKGWSEDYCSLGHVESLGHKHLKPKKSLPKAALVYPNTLLRLGHHEGAGQQSTAAQPPALECPGPTTPGTTVCNWLAFHKYKYSTVSNLCASTQKLHGSETCDAALCLWATMLGVQLFLYQTEQHQFVSVNETATIPCLSIGKSDGGHNIRWYRRRVGETPRCIKSCEDDGTISRIACKTEGNRQSLVIHNVHQNDTGVYYCTDVRLGKLNLLNGSTLRIGDGYTARSSVLLLTTSPQQHVSGSSVPLACVVTAVSRQVWVSWKISGTSGQGWMSFISNQNGTFTVINHIIIAPEAWASGEVSCEVQFNTSRGSVKRTAPYKAVPASAPSWCLALLIAGVLLLLLTLSLTLFRIYQSSDPGTRQRQSVAADAGGAQSNIVYADLDFHTKNPKRNRRQGRVTGKKM